MSKRIPNDAFAYYVGLGPSRSYAKVAEHYDVHKRSLTRYAVRHNWQSRLLAAEAQADQRTDAAAVDAIEEMAQRHLKCCRAVQARALEALRAMPLTSASAAVRALDMALRNERLILGEPSERTAHSVEDVVRREFSSWMTEDVVDAESWDDGDDWGDLEDEPNRPQLPSPSDDALTDDDDEPDDS